MLGEVRSLTWEEAYGAFIHDQPLPRFVQASGEAIPPDPLAVPVPEADLPEVVEPEPPGCGICED